MDMKVIGKGGEMAEVRANALVKRIAGQISDRCLQGLWKAPLRSPEPLI